MSGAALLGAHGPWVEEHLGEVREAEDASCDHAASDVVRVVCARGAAFLKRHRDRRKFDQERSAYAGWCNGLDAAATLLAATESPGPALLVHAAPGAPLAGLISLSADVERAHWSRAGAFLAALHALPHEDEDEVPLPDAWTRRAEAWVRRAGRAITRREAEGVLSLARAPWPESDDRPRRVPCHRDFTPRNWIVTEDSLAVIDFEHARADWALVDLGRALEEVPEDREDLAAALWAGYGADRTALEVSLPRVLAVQAVARIAWAVEHGDARFERSGRELLRRACP
ncbi:MAG: aminoglycoside phosphotransferase family protein [Planctomycetota bacterium]|nr:aminoglycoside phosphotransferase family protein [Planctomycetota bacterium]